MKVAQSISVAAMVFASAALAQDAGQSPFDDPGRGKLIAETWCASCHLVSADEHRPALADVPPFTAIARRLPKDADVLVAFIIDPHPPMPNLGLSRQDIRDVLAYVATLK
jgi:mono/diheme cytochrome c family protein